MLLVPEVEKSGITVENSINLNEYLLEKEILSVLISLTPIYIMWWVTPE